MKKRVNFPIIATIGILMLTIYGCSQSALVTGPDALSREGNLSIKSVNIGGDFYTAAIDNILIAKDDGTIGQLYDFENEEVGDSALKWYAHGYFGPTELQGTEEWIIVQDDSTNGSKVVGFKDNEAGVISGRYLGTFSGSEYNFSVDVRTDSDYFWLGAYTNYGYFVYESGSVDPWTTASGPDEIAFRYFPIGIDDVNNGAWHTLTRNIQDDFNTMHGVARDDLIIYWFKSYFQFTEIPSDTFTIGFWKNNIRKNMGYIGEEYPDRKKGAQLSGEELYNYLQFVGSFGLEVFENITPEEAFDFLSSNSSDPIDLLKKQLLAAELNFASGARYGSLSDTAAWLVSGEEMVLNPTADILDLKDEYDFWNNM